MFRDDYGTTISTAALGCDSPASLTAVTWMRTVAPDGSPMSVASRSLTAGVSDLALKLLEFPVEEDEVASIRFDESVRISGARLSASSITAETGFSNTAT